MKIVNREKLYSQAYEIVDACIQNKEPKIVLTDDNTVEVARCFTQGLNLDSVDYYSVERIADIGYKKGSKISDLYKACIDEKTTKSDLIALRTYFALQKEDNATKIFSDIIIQSTLKEGYNILCGDAEKCYKDVDVRFKALTPTIWKIEKDKQSHLTPITLVTEEKKQRDVQYYDSDMRTRKISISYDENFAVLVLPDSGINVHFTTAELLRAAKDWNGDTLFITSIFGICKYLNSQVDTKNVFYYKGFLFVSVDNELFAWHRYQMESSESVIKAICNNTVYPPISREVLDKIPKSILMSGNVDLIWEVICKN